MILTRDTLRIKNINSLFKFISDAVEYEIERQIQLIESGEKVKQQNTLVGYKNMKLVLCSKEEAADYRYFLDPDLPIIEINNEWIECICYQLPELPDQKTYTFKKTIWYQMIEADILIEDRELLFILKTANTLQIHN